MDSSKTIQYIKCLNRTDLIKYLREENYTAVADILQQRDIDGIRFLELNELDLVQWRLNPRQKKIILECRDKLIDKKPPQTLKKPAVATKPPQLLRPKLNSHNTKIADLQSKLQLEKIPCNVPKILHDKSKVYPKPNAQNSNDDEYMDMTQDNAPAHSGPVKNNINLNAKQKRNTYNQFHPHMIQNTGKQVVKSTSLKNPSELGTKPLNNYSNKPQRSLPTPPQLLLSTQNRGINIDIQETDQNYENPDDIKSDKIKFKNTKSFEDEDIYEDPDSAGNQKTTTQILASSFTQNLVENKDNYDNPNDIDNGIVIKPNKMPGLPKRPLKFSRNNLKQNDENYEDPNDISKKQINKMYPFKDERPQKPTQLFLNQNKPTRENHFCKNYQEQEETYEDPDDVLNNPKILPSFQKPHNFSQLKRQDKDEVYEDPQDMSPENFKSPISLPDPILKRKNPQTQISSDDETYEDPDMIKGSSLNKHTKEDSEEEDYEIPLEKKQLHNQKNCITSRPLPPLPPTSFAGEGVPVVPPKLKDVARRRSKDDFFDKEPHLLGNVRSSNNEDAILPPVPCGYDNHRLSKKTNSSLVGRNSSDAISQIHTWDDSLPPPPLEFVSTLPKEKGDIWNTFKQSDLPTPPKFERKFKHADSAYMKMYVEAEEHPPISSKNFNLNDFPFFRNTDRTGARQLLEKIKNIQNGAFLIRKSNEFYLVITMFYNNRFYNVGIDKNDDGTIYCKTTEDREPKSFNSLYEFVQYYKVHPLTMTTKGNVINIYLIEQLTADIF